MKTLLQFLKRGFLLLISQSNYSTPRQRMWSMYSLGKAQGIKEALKDLPIVQVQPRQTVQPVEVHLPPGEWTRQYRASHLIVPPIVRTNSAPLDPATDFPEWLNSVPKMPTFDQAQAMLKQAMDRVPTAKNLTSGLDETTEEMPAFVKAIHQDRYETHRHAAE